MRTWACKLYSRVFWIFMPNVIKIYPYSFELYRFKVCAFFEIHLILIFSVLFLIHHFWDVWSFWLKNIVVPLSTLLYVLPCDPMQSTVMPQYVVRLSVRLFVCPRCHKTFWEIWKSAKCQCMTNLFVDLLYYSQCISVNRILHKWYKFMDYMQNLRLNQQMMCSKGEETKWHNCPLWTNICTDKSLILTSK